MNQQPKISVVIPCYNQSEFLNECIISILEQEYSNWECIIVNDGSLDDTEVISLQLCNLDKRISYFKKANGGLSSARNYGITKASGTLILPLDADDKISKNYISTAIEIIIKENTSVIVYGKCVYFGLLNGVCNLPEFHWPSFLLRNQIHCSGIYHKSDWVKVGGYDENMLFGNEDWEFWIRMIAANCKVIYNEDMKFYYRQKESSMLATTLSKKGIIHSYIVNKHFRLYEDTLDFVLVPYLTSKRFSIIKLIWRRLKNKIKSVKQR